MDTYMRTQVIQEELQSIQEMILMHEDVTKALTALPDFGFNSSKNLHDIHHAKAIIDDLENVLEDYIHIGNSYQETFNQLLNLFEEIGIFQCVDDLIAVRRNLRKTTKVSSIAAKEVSNF